MSRGQTEVKAQCAKFRPVGIFSALSETAASVAKDTMRAANARGTIVSYDPNYRQSLWKSCGERKPAPEGNRELSFSGGMRFSETKKISLLRPANQAIDQGQRFLFRDHVRPQ